VVRGVEIGAERMGEDQRGTLVERFLMEFADRSTTRVPRESDSNHVADIGRHFRSREKADIVC